MSVNNSRECLKTFIMKMHKFLFKQLQNYNTYLLQTQNQIQNTVNMKLSNMLKERQVHNILINQLKNENIQLKEDNSFLRTQYMAYCIKEEQLKNSRQILLKQNAQKEERVRILAQQVEKIKKYMGNLNNQIDDDKSANFNESQVTQVLREKLESLEIIKQVSEHDLSATMSLQSLQSQTLDDQPVLRNSQIQKQNQNLGNQNYQIQDYQDALFFLKSYNSKGRGIKMTKKPLIQQKIPQKEIIIKKDLNIETQIKGNQTINKIKKMRKIQDTNIQQNINPTKYGQQNNYLQGNEIIYHENNLNCSIAQSKIEYTQNQQNILTDKTKSSNSINSNKFKSQVKQAIVNLQHPIKQINQILSHINVANSHALQKEKINTKFIKIGFVGGLSFIGNYDENLQPNGFGKLILNKECIYQGEWRNGKFHGWGKFILLPFIKQGQKSILEIDGHFKYGMAQGNIVCTFTNGQRFIGMIKNQNIEKEGTFVSEQGIMTGFWQKCKLINLI